MSAAVVVVVVVVDVAAVVVIDRLDLLKWAHADLELYQSIDQNFVWKQRSVVDFQIPSVAGSERMANRAKENVETIHPVLVVTCSPSGHRSVSEPTIHPFAVRNGGIEHAYSLDPHH